MFIWIQMRPHKERPGRFPLLASCAVIITRHFALYSLYPGFAFKKHNLYRFSLAWRYVIAFFTCLVPTMASISA